MSSILIVDCFDSFTYNLQHYLDELNEGNVSVIRYDKFTLEGAKGFSHIVLSPGPGLPKHYPKLLDYLKSRPINQSVLGVCLGHQCLGFAFGSKMQQLDEVVHGQTMKIRHCSSSIIFKNLYKDFESGHYHSWVLDEKSIPKDVLTITSSSSEGLVMSIEHKILPYFGVQFHPESVMTTYGKKLLSNWLLGTKI